MLKIFEQNFCKILERLQTIQTDASRNKFSDGSPLKKFINSESIISLKKVEYNEFQDVDDHQLQIISYKEEVAIELRVVFDQLEVAVFTIKEILVATPNTKDEENYANWYPFKSRIVVYVDFDEANYNLQMKIDDDSIRVVKRDQTAGSNRSDYQLLYALTRCFSNVKSPYSVFKFTLIRLIL